MGGAKRPAPLDRVDIFMGMVGWMDLEMCLGSHVFYFSKNLGGIWQQKKHHNINSEEHVQQEDGRR